MKENAGKRSKANPTAPTAHAAIKKPRRGVVERCPQIPLGENEASLQAAKDIIKAEMALPNPTYQIVSIFK